MSDGASPCYGYVDSKPNGDPLSVGKGCIGRVKTKARESDWHIKTSQKYPEWNRETVFKGSESDCFKLEIALIAHYGRRDLGLGTLVNLTDGGDGARGAVRTQETRSKISAAKLGKPMAPETKEKLSLAMLGRQISKDIVEKSAQIRRGRKNTPETLLKMSIAAKNRPPISEVTRAKLRIANGGRVMSDEARARMSALRLGKPRTEETKMKMRLAFERKRLLAEQRDGQK